MLSSEIQLSHALEAYKFALQLAPGFPMRHLLHFHKIGIPSMPDLAVNVDYITIDMELISLSPKEKLLETTLQYLKSFLPGPVGFPRFRLAQMAARKSRKKQPTRATYIVPLVERRETSSGVYHTNVTGRSTWNALV